jgi:hypothetical protein
MCCGIVMNAVITFYLLFLKECFGIDWMLLSEFIFFLSVSINFLILCTFTVYQSLTLNHARELHDLTGDIWTPLSVILALMLLRNVNLATLKIHSCFLYITEPVIQNFFIVLCMVILCGSVDTEYFLQ